MKVVDGANIYSVSDLAREISTPHSSLMTWIWRDEILPKPNKTLPGGRRLFYSEEVYQTIVTAFKKGQVRNLAK